MVDLGLPGAHLGLLGLGADAAGRIAVLAQRGPYAAPDTLLLRLPRDGTALTRGPRGTLLLAGNDGRRPRAPLPERPWVARITRAGRVTRTYLPPTSRKIEILAMARDRRGRIVLGGAERTLDDVAALLRLTPDGRPDRRFGRGGAVFMQLGARPRATLCCSEIRAVAIDARDRILAAGVSFDADASREDLARSWFAVARLKG